MDEHGNGPPITTDEVEGFLDGMDDLYEFVLEHPTPIRCYDVLKSGKIIAETCSDLIATFVFADDPRTREEMAGEDPAALAAWDRAAHLYLAGWDNLREDASGAYFVDTATSDLDFAENTVRMIGGKVRTREQTLNDREHPGLADALAAWERHDDSVYAGVRVAGARSRQELIADRRAKLRWGMLPVGEG